jgi:putative tryptophan/tyrosine transport system substrate-binding protein
MRRRDFLTLFGGTATVWSLAARAQQPARVPRVGIIDNAPIWDHFRAGLRDHGYVEGGNITFEYRTAQGKPDLLVAAAAELARLPVDVIATFGTLASLAAKQATTTIPIVAISVGDPVRVGLVASLAFSGYRR